MNTKKTYESCLKKQEELIQLFSKMGSFEEKYQYIIDLGKKAPPLAPEDKNEESRVYGCQSRLFLKTSMKEGNCFFQTEADALISQGLGVLLTMVYSGEPPEAVLLCPPTFFEKIGLTDHLSPSRVQGVGSLYTKMKKEVLKFI